MWTPRYSHYRMREQIETIWQKTERTMPRRRQPRAVWRVTRLRVWHRDQGHCQGPYCRDLAAWSLAVDRAHIDHIESGKRGSNADSNLRTLCRRCHVLRADMRHRGMISHALRDGIIPPDWRHLVWDDEDDTVDDRGAVQPT